VILHAPGRGFQIRPVRSNCRPSVAVYRTSLIENRLNSKSCVQPVPTGMTGLPAGMIGLEIFYFLNSNLNFELEPVDRYDRFGNFYFFNSNLNFEFGPV
jgi:hypothetical protein